MSEENFLNAFRKKLDQKQCHTEGNDDVSNTHTKVNTTTTLTSTNLEDNTITDNTVVPKGRVSHYMKKNILPKELLEEFKKEKPTTEHHHKEPEESQFEKEKKSSIADIVQDPNNYFSSGTNKDDNNNNITNIINTNNNVNPITTTTTSTSDFKSKLNMFNATTPNTSERTSTSKNKLLSHLRQVQQVPSSTTDQPITTSNTYNIRTQISTEPRQSVRDLLKLNEERLKLLQDEKDERERRDSVKQKNREAWKLRMQKLSEFIRSEKDPNESDKDFYEDNIEVLKEYGITNFKDFKETLAFFENANYAKQRNSSYFPKNPLSKAELAKITEETELNQDKASEIHIKPHNNKVYDVNSIEISSTQRLTYNPYTVRNYNKLNAIANEFHIKYSNTKQRTPTTFEIDNVTSHIHNKCNYIYDKKANVNKTNKYHNTNQFNIKRKYATYKYLDELQIQSNTNEPCIYEYNKHSHTNNTNACCNESNFNVNRKYITRVYDHNDLAVIKSVVNRNIIAQLKPQLRVCDSNYTYTYTYTHTNNRCKRSIVNEIQYEITPDQFDTLFQMVSNSHTKVNNINVIDTPLNGRYCYTADIKHRYHSNELLIEYQVEEIEIAKPYWRTKYASKFKFNSEIEYERIAHPKVHYDDNEIEFDNNVSDVDVKGKCKQYKYAFSNEISNTIINNKSCCYSNSKLMYTNSNSNNNIQFKFNAIPIDAKYSISKDTACIKGNNKKKKNVLTKIPQLLTFEYIPGVPSTITITQKQNAVTLTPKGGYILNPQDDNDNNNNVVITQRNNTSLPLPVRSTNPNVLHRETETNNTTNNNNNNVSSSNYQKNIITSLDAISVMKYEISLNPLFMDVICINCYECVKLDEMDNHSQTCTIPLNDYNDNEYDTDDYNTRIFKLHESLKSKKTEITSTNNATLTSFYTKLLQIIYDILINNNSIEELASSISSINALMSVDISSIHNNDYKSYFILLSQRLSQLVYMKYKDMERILGNAEDNVHHRNNNINNNNNSIDDVDDVDVDDDDDDFNNLMRDLKEDENDERVNYIKMQLNNIDSQTKQAKDELEHWKKEAKMLENNLRKPGRASYYNNNYNEQLSEILSDVNSRNESADVMTIFSGQMSEFGDIDVGVDNEMEMTEDEKKKYFLSIGLAVKFRYADQIQDSVSIADLYEKAKEMNVPHTEYQTFITNHLGISFM